MQIRELYIKNFGKFSEEHFYLSEHIQVFYGKNEYGKSTIYAFIKAMLFGMERGRGRAALRDAFTRYEPWENPNYYAGVMRFTCGGRNFYLERSFDRYTKHAVLICEDDGETLSVEDGDLEMLLGGISRTSFENMAAIGQLSACPGQDLAEELKNYAANYYETGGCEVDLKQVFLCLKERRREILQQINELQDKKRIRYERIEAQISYLQREENALEQEWRQKQGILKKTENELALKEKERNKKINIETRNDIDDRKDKKQTGKSFNGQWVICFGIVLFFAGVGIFLWNYIQGNASLLNAGGMALSGVGILLAAVGGILKKQLRKKYRKDGRSGNRLYEESTDIRKEQDHTETENHEEEDAGKQILEKIRWECERISEELHEKQTQKQNLKDQLEEFAAKTDEVIPLEQTKAALELAEERIRLLASKMAEGFGKTLNQKASGILSEITQGKYTRLCVEEGLKLYVLMEGRKIPAEYLSRGTLEQIYFSLRMAALDMLYEEDIPVVFDDAFAFYDEKRLKSALKWLREQPRQVIIFSCQRREKEMLSGE